MAVISQVKKVNEAVIEKIAAEIVESFKLEPLEGVSPEAESVEFDTPEFDGAFGDGADAKGDGVV